MRTRRRFLPRDRERELPSMRTRRLGLSLEPQAVEATGGRGYASVAATAMEEDVAVLICRGELPPGARPTNVGTVLAAEAAEVENGQALIQFLHQPNDAELYVGKEMHGGQFAWKPLKASLHNIPRVDNQVIVFIQASGRAVKRHKPVPSSAGVSDAPDDIVKFWRSLPSAVESTEVVEVDARIVTPAIVPSTLTLVASSSAPKRNRKKPVLSTVLKLQDGVMFPHIQASKIWVRSVYPKFVNLAIKVLQGELAGEIRTANVPGTVRHLFVTGSPGTGKTMWGFYLLYNLCRNSHFSGRTMIWEECLKEGGGVSYYFKQDVVKIGKPGDFDSLFDNDTIILVNGPVLRPRQPVGHIIMFCAAESSCQVAKDTHKYTVYMPLWGLCELVLAGKMHGMGEGAIRKEYKKWGGSARCVLLQYWDPDWDRKFVRALNSVKEIARIRYEVGSMLQSKDSSSFILHLSVVNEECTETIVKFASEYVKEEIEKLSHQEDLMELIDYVNRHKFVNDERAIVGKRFEALVHKLFSSRVISTLKFKARQLIPSLGVTEEISFQLGGGSAGIFHKLDAIPDGSVGYFVPDYETYPCYDALIFLRDTTSALQVTLKKHHPALLQYVEELLEDHLLEKFYYVVPEENFNEFPVQKIKDGNLDVEWPSEVEVWVIAIPADFYNFHLHRDLAAQSSLLHP